MTTRDRRRAMHALGRLHRSLISAAVMTGTLCTASAATASSHPAAVSSAARPTAQMVEVTEMSISQLRRSLEAGATTSEQLVQAYLQLIARLDRSGPRLASVLAVDPTATAQARELDRERAAGRVRGPLHGIPILIKDNIETDGPLPTTAGSLALLDNVVHRDAPLVASLRRAGAIILGKTNLSEWANIRSSSSTSGWSAVGGLVRNPYALDRNACGSSSGSGVAAAASLAAATVGTETNGSITCPASISGVVGLKPTVGLISQAGIIPISHSQDTAGPMARSVEDAAALLQGMIQTEGVSPKEQLRSRAAASFDAAKGTLVGVRIGVVRWAVGSDPKVRTLFERALADLSAAGAELVDVDRPGDVDDLGDAEMTILMTELKVGLNAYLSRAAPQVRTRTLKELIAFNTATPDSELRWFGQDLFTRSEATSGLSDPKYLKAREKVRSAAGPQGIGGMLASGSVQVLVAPTTGPAWLSDLVNGDHYGSGGIGGLAAMAGLPHLTVPMGDVEGLPVGLSLVGASWTDGRLLELGLGYETQSVRRRPPTFRSTTPSREETQSTGSKR